MRVQISGKRSNSFRRALRHCEERSSPENQHKLIDWINFVESSICFVVPPRNDIKRPLCVLHFSEQFQRLRHCADLLDGQLKFVVDLLDGGAFRVAHDVLHNLLESRTLKVFRFRVADEIRRHVVVAQQYLLEAQILGNPTQTDGIEQVVDLLGDGSEAVDEVVGEFHQALLGLGAVEFAIKADTLLCRVDVVGGETYLHVGLDGAVSDV